MKIPASGPRFQSPCAWPPIGSLGDLFVLSGAVKYYSYSYPKVFVPIVNNLKDLADCVFSDFDNIHAVNSYPWSGLNDFLKSKNSVYMSDQIELFTEDSIPLVHEWDLTPRHVVWDEQLYTLFGVPYYCKYAFFYLPEQCREGSKNLYESLIENDEEYILIARNYSTKNLIADNLKIDCKNKKVIELNQELHNNPLEYFDLIKNASEIHCVNSAIFNLVDLFAKYAKGSLVYHDVRKTRFRLNNIFNLSKWDYVPY